MKSTILIALMALISLSFGSTAFTDECTTIQEGTIERLDGVIIETGYDEWGYNYQAHMFNGTYCDAYRDAAWC